MAFKIESTAHVMTRVNTMKRRAKHSRDMMRKADLWRNMLKDYLLDDIWHDVPENARRWTTMCDYPSAVLDAGIAMLSTDRPQVTVTPRRSYSIAAQDASNAFESAGAAIFDTLNLNRSTTVETQVADYSLSRANLVAKITSLDDEERGEVRSYTQPMLSDVPFSEQEAPEFEILEEGDFPILYQLLDPLDCYWTLGKDDRVIEFAHAYTATWDVLCDEFPDLYTHEKFKDMVGTVDYADTPVEVIDYWHEGRDGIYNCIMLGGDWFKEPTITDLPFMPIVVEEVNAREVPIEGSGKPRQRMGKIFVEYILEYAAEVSWCMSLGRSYIEMMPFATLFLTGVDPTDARNFLMNRRDTDGNPIFEMVMDNSPGGKAIPLPPGVGLEYPPVPELVPILQELKSYYTQSMQNQTMPQSVLSGDVQGPPSGYAYFQMKQVPMAKLGPYEIGCNRFLSRSLEMIARILVHDWDRLDAPLVLQKLSGQSAEGMEEVELTKEDLAQIGSVQVRMKMSLPSNKEQEDTAVIQKNQTGLMSDTTAIETMGDVQDANAEWEQAMAQNWIKMNPDAQARIAATWMDKRGYLSVQPQPPPPQPAPAGQAALPHPSPSPVPGGPVPAGPPPGMGMMPPDPSMMQPAMAGPPMGPPGIPMEQNGQQPLPPELLALLQGGGMPQ